MTDQPHDPIVGHKTMPDGSHVPLLKSEGDAIWASADAAQEKRAADMPTEQDAIHAMWSAYQRLRELGWRNAIYCPKDGTEFDAIEAGFTGIHRAHYQGDWPNGGWWIADGGDLWPSRPVLYRPTEAQIAKRKEVARKFREVLVQETQG